jgi:Short-chain dehydrogenase involved in D-alanine esterification of lipoteichoic acid and wall teichoic acid (D-alanine transfer protein)
MNITNNTILITGGGSGIGLEIAKALSPSNKIIIVGRNEEN